MTLLKIPTHDSALVSVDILQGGQKVGPLSLIDQMLRFI